MLKYPDFSLANIRPVRMNLACEHCNKEGSLEEHGYSGKRVRLRCPYCAGNFIFQVPANGTVPAEHPDMTVAAVTSAPPMPELHQAPVPPPPAEAVAESVAVETPANVDETLVHEAKRIARLIISEVKLYNQEKINRAKSKREVLELLKNDLIRGKQHYNTRIASKLPATPDYFMETVKEILLAGKS